VYRRGGHGALGGTTKAKSENMGRKKGSKSGTTRVMTRSKPKVVEEDKDSDLDVMDQDFVGFEGSARKSAEEESESEVEEVLDLGGVDEVIKFIV